MTLWTSELGAEGNLALTLPRGGLSGHIEAFLARHILSGELPAGSTLPSQDELVRQFGVSRAVVREAIAALTARGLLAVRHGRSTHVTEPAMWNVLDPFLVGVYSQLGAIRSLLQDLFAVRLLIEPEAAAMIALRHTPDQLAAIAEPVDRLDRVSAAPPRTVLVDADRDFHWQIALATDNQVLISMVRSFQALLWTQFGISAFDQLPRVLAQHRAVSAAIASGDSDGARESMRVHLIDARDRFFGFMRNSIWGGKVG